MLNRTDAVLGYLSEAIPRYVLGSDPFQIERLVQRMFREDFGRAGEIIMTATALVEMACWDIIGKALGSAGLSPAGRRGARTYQGLCQRLVQRGAHAGRISRSRKERCSHKGYRALKFDPFGAGFYELERAEKLRVIELVEAVRDAVGPDVEIMIEMHGRFNPVTAIELTRELARFIPAWVEEPVPPENIAALRKTSEAIAALGVPVATGERMHTMYEFRELFEMQAADIIQPDISHFGGILNTKKLAAWAEAYYVLIAPHNVGGPVSTAAALHLAACTTNFKIQEHFNDFGEDYVLSAAPGLPKVVDGYFSLPQGPGLGVTLDEDVIAANPRQKLHFNLFAEDWHKRDARD